MKKKTRTTGLKILFGPKYRLWTFDETKLPYVTHYIQSKQMSKMAHFLYSQVYKLKVDDPSLLVWDMFGGIGTDAIHLSEYFNVVVTEMNENVFQIMNKNITAFHLTNVNLIRANCLIGLKKIKSDIIYYDPPWGDSWSKSKNYKNKNKFDFNQVYIDYPLCPNDPIPELTKKISTVDLAKYLYQNVTPNMIIKSPFNSDTFDNAFNNKIHHIQSYPNKNIKFLYLK